MISKITLDDSSKWDEVVKSFSNYDVNYLSSYSMAFKKNGDGTPLLILYENKGTKAINVVMIRDISLNENFTNLVMENQLFDISTPYGYGGFLIEGDDFNTLEDEYLSFCKEQGYISEFVRFHLYSNYIGIFSGQIESTSSNVVRPLDLSVDDILMDFEYKVRKNIKNAISFGLQVEIDDKGLRFADFLNVYYGTMDRNSANKNFYFPETFFDSINKMIGNFVYIHVIYEDKVIASELVLYGVENCYSFLGGTISDYFYLHPNHFLKFEIVKWAKEKGLKRFILGGGYGEDDGIFKYKKSFSPNGILKFNVGKRIIDIDKYNELVKIRESDLNFCVDTNYFPKYRG